MATFFDLWKQDGSDDQRILFWQRIGEGARLSVSQPHFTEPSLIEFHHHYRLVRIEPLTEFIRFIYFRRMITISANAAKQSFGRVLDDAQREPVMIQKHNRSAAVILSIAEYERLRGLNIAEFEAFCEGVSEVARSRGLTEEKLDELLSED